MLDIKRDNRVVSLSSRAGIRNSLVNILDQLQRCQKSLNEFLEVNKSMILTKKKNMWQENLRVTFHRVIFHSKWVCVLLLLLQEKRSAFPRFYFIGDDDLLEILGQATNPTVIQSHLKKLFAGENSVFCSISSNLVFFFRQALHLFFVNETWILPSLSMYGLCRYPQCCVWWALPQYCGYVFSGGRNSTAQKPCSHLKQRGGKTVWCSIIAPF